MKHIENKSIQTTVKKSTKTKKILSSKWLIRVLVVIVFGISCEDLGPEIKSNQAKIESFSFGEQEALIDEAKQTITYTVPYGTNIGKFSPKITYSKKAQLTPKAYAVKDFSKPVNYVVTAEDGSKRTYTVKVEVMPNDQAEILSFKIGRQLLKIEEGVIRYSFPPGTDLTRVKPIITVSPDATVTPNTKELQDLSKPLTYSVMAQDGKTKKDYVVKLGIQDNAEASIEKFLIKGTEASIENNYIMHLLPYGTDLTSIKPKIDISVGASISPASNVSQDFSKPVTYTVTAEDGKTKTNYTVQMRVAANHHAAIEEFSINGKKVFFNGDTITYTAPYGTNLYKVAPIIQTSADAKVYPASGEAQDFSKPVIYTVTSADGNTQHKYAVNLSMAKNHEALIEQFSIAGNPGIIDGDNISYTAPYGTDIRSTMAPTIQASADAKVYPPSGEPQDFSKPVIYTVTSADGNTQHKYAVNMSVAKNHKAEMMSITLDGKKYRTDYNDIEIELPATSDLKSIIPEFEISGGASISLLQKVKTDFSSPIDFTITSEDQSKTVSGTIRLSRKRYTEAKVLSYTLTKNNVPCFITEPDDEQDKGLIEYFFHDGRELDYVYSNIQLSPGATLKKSLPRNLDLRKYYEITVVSEDEQTENTYRIEVDNSYLERAENGVTIRVRDKYLARLGGLLESTGYIKGVAFEQSRRPYTIVTEQYLRDQIEKGYLRELPYYVTTAVTNMETLLYHQKEFNEDISHWDLSNVTSVQYMLASTDKFNQDISNWDVSSVKNFSGCFFRAKAFNQPIGKWDVRNGEYFTEMFHEAENFNQSLNDWQLDNAIDLKQMFKQAVAFNGNISDWRFPKVTDLSSMFRGAFKFNQSLYSWDVSNVTNFEFMFDNAIAFNQEINNWDVHNGKDFSNMFSWAAKFNSNISAWKTSKAEDFREMFKGATSFNQDLDGWDVSQVRRMQGMFEFAYGFDYDLSSWNPPHIRKKPKDFNKNNRSLTDDKLPLIWQ